MTYLVHWFCFVILDGDVHLKLFTGEIEWGSLEAKESSRNLNEALTVLKSSDVYSLKFVDVWEAPTEHK